MAKMYIQKQETIQDLKKRISVLENQTKSLESDNKVKKFGAVIDTAIPTHTSPTKAGNGVMLQLKGKKRNYAVYITNEQLKNVSFGSECSVREYAKDGVHNTSVVIQIGTIRKWTGLPK